MPPRTHPHAHCRPWVTTTDPCRFAACKQRPTLVGDVDNGEAVYGGAGVYGYYIPFSPLCRNPKTALKKALKTNHKDLSKAGGTGTSPMRKQVGVGEGACRGEHGNSEWGFTSHSSTGVNEVTALPVRPVCFIKRGREHYHIRVMHLEENAKNP